VRCSGSLCKLRYIRIRPLPLPFYCGISDHMKVRKCCEFRRLTLHEANTGIVLYSDAIGDDLLQHFIYYIPLSSTQMPIKEQMQCGNWYAGH